MPAEEPGGGWALTFCGRGRLGVLLGVPEGERDAQELHVAVPVPHQQLLARLDVFAGLVEDLPLHLHGDQVLLVGEPRAFDQRHPVPRASSAVHEMAQLAVFEHLTAEKRTRGFRMRRGARPGVKPVVEHHLPHQRVVVVGFDLAGVDQFPLEGSEARPRGDAAPVGEHSAVGHGPPARLEDAQPWGPQAGVSLDTERDFTCSRLRGSPSGSSRASLSSGRGCESETGGVRVKMPEILVFGKRKMRQLEGKTYLAFRAGPHLKWRDPRSSPGCWSNRRAP